MESWVADIFWTYKFDNWVNKDKASGMLPFNRFAERDLNIKKNNNRLNILEHMYLATDHLLNTTIKSWI